MKKFSNKKINVPPILYILRLDEKMLLIQAFHEPLPKKILKLEKMQNYFVENKETKHSPLVLLTGYTQIKIVATTT